MAKTQIILTLEIEGSFQTKGNIADVLCRAIRQKENVIKLGKNRQYKLDKNQTLKLHVR